jgi:hypothetical protein
MTCGAGRADRYENSIFTGVSSRFFNIDRFKNCLPDYSFEWFIVLEEGYISKYRLLQLAFT